MADIPYSWLVVSTILKNMKVSWDYCSQYMEKIKIKKKYLVDIPIGIGISGYFVGISGWYGYIWLYLYLL